MSEEFEDQVTEALNVFDYERFSSDDCGKSSTTSSIDYQHYNDLSLKPKIKLFLEEKENKPCLICKIKQWFCF